MGRPSNGELPGRGPRESAGLVEEVSGRSCASADTTKKSDARPETLEAALEAPDNVD